MDATTISRGRLRGLSETRPEQGRVLSVFLDLDPAEFATAPARATQINAALIAAEHAVEAVADELSHDEHMALREDIAQIRKTLDPAGLGAGGIRGIAVFACRPAGLFEVLALRHPVATHVQIGSSPFIEPLAGSIDGERWCVVLVNRRDGRILLGDEDGLDEVERVLDDVVDTKTGDGGWAERRQQNTVEREKIGHLEHVAKRLMLMLRKRPFDRLVIGGPDPIPSDLEGVLHPYLTERLAGRIHVDVQDSGVDDILEAARPVIEEVRRSREREVLERLRAGLGRPDGRAAAGLPAVREALEQARVEILLLEPRSPHEEAIEMAIEQAAEVLVLHHNPDLGPLGGIAAILRY